MTCQLAMVGTLLAGLCVGATLGVIVLSVCVVGRR
jgi:hypothetical protein